MEAIGRCLKVCKGEIEGRTSCKPRGRVWRGGGGFLVRKEASGSAVGGVESCSKPRLDW